MHSRAFRLCVAASVGLWLGCGPGEPRTVVVREPDAGGRYNAGRSSDAGGGPDAGPSSDAGTDAMTKLPLPGSIYNHVLNLVDREAAAELDAALTTRTPGFANLEHCARAFYSLYPDEYDFLFFFSLHLLPGNVGPYALAINVDPLPGTGLTEPITRPQYFSSGRLKVIFPVPSYQTQGSLRPPFLRLIGNTWGNYFSLSLGFGIDAGRDVRPGWGLTSVHGQMGGFDATSLRCATPAGATPPDCTPESNGSYQFLVSDFWTSGNGLLNIPYSALEQYLMGLVPLNEVPESFLTFVDGMIDVTSRADGDRVTTVRAEGLAEIARQDIVKAYGTRSLLDSAQRHFTSAFVVFSATPASDEYMRLVSQYAETLGNYRTDDTAELSFEDATGGRATLDTHLGERRDPAYPLVALPSVTCDPLAQDCAGGEACYNPYEPNCRPAGAAQTGESCLVDTDCVTGTICMGLSPKLCAPFCDRIDAASTKACATLCPASFDTPESPYTGEPLVSICYAGAAP